MSFYCRSIAFGICVTIAQGFDLQSRLEGSGESAILPLLIEARDLQWNDEVELDPQVEASNLALTHSSDRKGKGIPKIESTALIRYLRD